VVNVMKGDVEVGSMLEKSIYAVALLLFLITLLMNYVSQIVLRRYREVYQ
jgi:phosphate transport system permease protein